MKILYFGSACDKEWFDNLARYNAMPYQVAQYMFEMGLLNGFSCFDDVQMEIYYVLQEPYYPRGKLRYRPRIRRLNERYYVSYLAGINLPVLKEISYFWQGMLRTIKWSLSNRKTDNKLIITPFNYVPLSLGIYLIARMFKINRLNFFTDMSNDIMTPARQQNMIWLKRIVLPQYKKLVQMLDTSFDLYVLFARAMNEIVNPYKKPYLVMEGIFSNNLDLAKVSKAKAIMYAGTLSFEYGVKTIIDAFDGIEDDSLQLWLFGNGDMNDYIQEVCRRDCRVTFFGFKSREEVFEYEKKAALLINIRNPEDQYTRYSFPSKVFEYMASGTPFLTTKIEGIPEEYYDYVYTVENNEIDSVKRRIEEILSLPQSELDEFGEKASHFIIDNKNQISQAQKLMEFIGLYNE